MIALQILAEAAKSSLQALRTLHNMARGFRPRDEAQSPPASTRTESSGNRSLSIKGVHTFSCINVYLALRL